MREKIRSLIPALMALIVSAGSIAGCSDRHDSMDRTQTSVKLEQAPPLDEGAKQAFRKKIDALGIPVYKKATFVDIKRKAKDSPLLYAEYEAPDTHDKTYKDVKFFYEEGLRRALGPKGWTRGQSADSIILYRKGFEIFYVELSRVIVLPDTKKIRIVMQYGA